MTGELPIERTRHIERVEPTNSPRTMPHADFRAAFEKPWRFPVHATISVHEHVTNTIHCVACMKTHSNGSVTAYRMYTAREKDLLGNFRSIVKLTCMHCGCTEQAPSRVELGEEQPTYEKLYEEYRKNFGRNDISEQRMRQLQAMQQQQQAMSQFQNMSDYGQRMASMQSALAGAVAPLGGFRFTGGVNKPVEPMTATEVRIRQDRAGQEVMALREAEKAGASRETIERIRKRIMAILGCVP